MVMYFCTIVSTWLLASRYIMRGNVHEWRMLLLACSYLLLFDGYCKSFVVSENSIQAK